VYNVNRRDYPAFPSPRTQEGIQRSDVTLGKLFNSSGYSTHQYGKWHLLDQDLPYYPDMYREHLEYAREMASLFEDVRRRDRAGWMDWYSWALPVKVDPRFREAVHSLGDRWKKEKYSEFVVKMGRLELPLEKVFDVRVAGRTIQRIRSPGTRPFLITCSFNYPHDPNVVPSPYYEMFPPEEIRLPGNSGYREKRFEREWSRRIVADLGERGAREFLRIYHASVRLIDDQLGKILKALDESGKTGNTILVFTADHGDMAGGHGMVWKSTSAFYDEIVRIPLILRYPRRVRPGRLDIAASSVDILPTLLALAGKEIPDSVQGRNLAPFLLGKRPASDGPAYSYSERIQPNRERTRRVAPGTPGDFMIRGRRWKYIRYRNGEEYLYDLRGDPGELKNLAADPEFQERKEKLRRRLEEWLEDTGYPR